MQLASVSKVRIEEVFRAPKVLMDEKYGYKCGVVAWNQLQFTSVSSERIEEVLTTPKSRHGREVRSEVRSGHMEQVAVHLSDCQKWYFWTENVKKVGGGEP